MNALATPTELDTELVKIQSAATRLRAELERIERREQAIADQYRRDLWTRYWVVPGGHVHSSTACHTCYPTTRFVFLPALSGKARREVVELAGERACTACFPDAPVEARQRPTQIKTDDERAEEGARAARADAAKARRAKAEANAITTPSGEPLLEEPRGSVVRTVRTAEAYYVDQAAYLMACEYGYRGTGLVDEATWYVGQFLAAISHRNGTTPDIERAQRATKIAARCRRDYGISRP
ncbi:hypothetical protein CcI49_03205 [Frankia sp. CcI49]|uniref:hypothetical protein n=1 Tax=Frankia sp. CcI49 TaxID=1745382 RepID=UPI00097605C0|nr:hypothetical protein [Frankia sp. CcI49]ONH62401.1 hypothetical protein CcI49_03205 [Frankia sp. CcI49]